MKDYLQFAYQFEIINRAHSLTSHEIEILNLVARSHALNKRLYVGDVIHENKIASQATLHKALKCLLKKKLLISISHPVDGRIKELALTDLSLDRYKRLSKAMHSAVLVK